MHLPRLEIVFLGFAAICAIVARTSSSSPLKLSSPLDNRPPVAQDDSYTVHGSGTVGPVLTNDHDPENDPMTAVLVAFPTQGSLSGLDGNSFGYAPNDPSFTGTDSFTYQACDNHSNCSNTATVTITIVNHAPVAVSDEFRVRANTSIVFGPMLANDRDSDPGDHLSYAQLSGASHGTVSGITQPDIQAYTPDTDYVGSDSFTYKACDQFGLCSSPVAVTFWVTGGSESDGSASCNSRTGRPINVTNGNMYLGQMDHSLPTTGPAIDVTRTYNSNSQSIGIFGRGWSTAYDESIAAYDANLNRLNLADGRAIYLGSPVGSSGGLLPLAGDFHGQLAQNAGGSTLSMKDGSVHQFSAAGKLLSFVDRNGNTTVLGYGANGFLSAVTDPFGRTLAFTTNGNGQVLSISDPLGTIASYTYGGGHEMLSVTYADNSAFQFTYDANYRLTAVADALGNVIESHTYDGQGRASTSEKQGGVEHYSLNYLNTTETDVTDALGRVMKYTFETRQGRNVVTRVEGVCNCAGGSGSQIRNWTYDGALNATSMTDALGHAISYTYDGNGNRLSETNSLGTANYTYNQFGDVLTATDHLGNLTTNTYDAWGNLVSREDALHNTSTFTYNTRGQLLTATDARGQTATFTYSSTTGNLTKSKDALAQTMAYTYDTRNRVTQVQDPLGRSTYFAYDAAGRRNK